MTLREWATLFTLIAVDGVCYAAIKLGLQSASPAAFGGLRALLAAVVLLLLAGVFRAPILPRGRDWWRLALLGLVATTATYGAMFTSPTRMGTGLASLLGNVQPLFVVLLGALFLGEDLSARKVTAMLVGIAGVVLVLWPTLSARSAGARSLATGSLVALGTSLAIAVASVLVKRLQVRPGLLGKTGWQLLIGSAPLLAVAGAQPNGLALAWSPQFTAILLFLSLFGTALSTTLWFWLLQRHDAGRLSIFLFLIPVISLGVGAVVFAERVHALQGLGVLVVLTALVLVARKPSGHTADQPAARA